MGRIRVKQGVNAGLEWDLPPGISVVGRDLRNHICLTDLRVSRKHFEIERRDNRFIARNLSTTNGTFLRGEPIVEETLRDGDLIALGDTVLEFVDQARTSQILFDEVDKTIGWMPQEEEQKQDINFTIALQQHSVRNMAESETDLKRLRLLTERLAMLQELSNSMIQEADESRLMSMLMEQVCAALEPDSGYLFMADQESQKLHPVVINERNRAGQYAIVDPAAAKAFKISRTLVQRAINERIGILAADTLRDDRFKDQGSIIMAGIRSAMCVPMIVNEEVLGLVHLDTKSVSRQFNTEDLKLLTMMMNQAAISLRNARLRTRIVAEETQRKALSRYVAPQLVDQLLKLGAEAGKARNVLISVLFCDIRGFTPMSERLAPEQVMELLSRFCSAVSETIFAHNGTVDKYIGDCVMAVFGSPAPEPRHARRAVDCALAILEATRKIQIEGRSLGVGIGVHTGPCIQGNLGSDAMMQFTAVGNTVNTASRLCGIAPPDTLLITENVIQTMGKDALAFDTDLFADEVQFKGKTERVPVFRILAKKLDWEDSLPPPQRGDAIRGVSGPGLIGRPSQITAPWMNVESTPEPPTRPGIDVPLDIFETE